FLHLSHSCASPFGPAILVTHDPNRSLGGIHWIQNFRRFCGLPALAVALVNTGVEEGPPKTVASRSPAQTSQSIRTRA
ncbi:MAG: hypothetical protein QOD29_3626, partial [Alphaproteobacteria bacterium]|nr:hypothetical protein [Alphaproteobacteria bacterium]